MVKLLSCNHNNTYTEEEKAQIIQKAAYNFGEFLTVLNFDWKNDPNMQDTPNRVAKAFVNEIISGCYSQKPNITAFDNNDEYDGMVCQNNIEVKSLCAHHFMPFTGVAHVAYIPTVKGKVIGLSKLNRIVEWFSRRPQIQESLSKNIHDYVCKVCEGNLGVAVVIEAQHTCCSNRGVKHDSTMRTAKFSGAFEDKTDTAKLEFIQYVNNARFPLKG